MENLTHSLFGLALYRSGLERYVPNSAGLWVIGANLPDVDIVVNFFGKAAYLEHHRGLTHSLPGILLLSFILSTGWFFWQTYSSKLFKKIYSIFYKEYVPDKEVTTLSWSKLFASSLLSIGTHPMLDALNNYGVRPLQPWSQNWFYGDLVFIADPWIWLILGGAIFLSSLRSLGLTIVWAWVCVIVWNIMFFSRRVTDLALTLWVLGISFVVFLRAFFRESFVINKFRVVQSALLLFAFYLISLFYFQTQALKKVENYFQTFQKDKITKFSVSPTAANPFQWEFLAESERYFYYGKLDLTNDSLILPKQIFVNRNSPILQEAFKTPEGKAMKNFSRYLIAEEQSNNGGTWITLCDGRYVRDFKSPHPEFACIKTFITKQQ